ncbi:MAG: hypothetical protein WCF67_07515 [Chitinophagaceae bacterium]
MRSLLLLVLMLLCCLQKAECQKDKTPIAIFPFVSALPEHRVRASQIQQLVVEILRRKSNIELIDRSNDSLMVKELDLQIREQSVAANGLVQQGKLLGAKQMIVGTVSNVTVETKTGTKIDFITKQPKPYTEYNASINFALQLSDVETGKVVSQKVFSNNDVGFSSLLGLLNITGQSREEAISNAINAARKKILYWINESYPPEIKILQVNGRDKKGNAETVLVSGIDGTLQRNSQVIVNVIEWFDAGGGNKLKRVRKIAVLKVKDIQGEITICKITDGEKALEEKMADGSKMEFILK